MLSRISLPCARALLTISYDVGDVVLVVCQAVQCKGCIVLQVTVAALQKVHQRPQTARLQSC